MRLLLRKFDEEPDEVLEDVFSFSVQDGYRGGTLLVVGRYWDLDGQPRSFETGNVFDMLVEGDDPK